MTATPKADLPAWLNTAARECASLVLVGAGERTFTEIIARHAAAELAAAHEAGKPADATAGEGKEIERCKEFYRGYWFSGKPLEPHMVAEAAPERRPRARAAAR